MSASSDVLGSDHEKWLDIDGGKKVWLKITFDESKPASTLR